MKRKLPCWITLEKNYPPEEKFFRKIIHLPWTPDYTEVQFTSTGPCALFVNGEFVESSTARYPNRINRHQLTGKLRKGKNVLALRLLTNYFQEEARQDYRKRRFWISAVALLLKARKGKKLFQQVTDDTWKARGKEETGWEKVDFDDTGWVKGSEIRLVKKQEYKRFWENAACWRTFNCVPASINSVIKIAGEKYEKQLYSSLPGIVFPDSLLEVSRAEIFQRDFDVPDYISSVRIKSGSESVRRFPFTPFTVTDETPEVILDFGRLVVGYLKIEFSQPVTGKLRCEFDYSESLTDFTSQAACGREIIEKLAVEETLKNQSFWFNYRRRAFRYLKLHLKFEHQVVIKNISLKESHYPVLNSGWFQCSDDLLNEIWNVSRYTLVVNMHQEYESCPRNEMLFFPGDGRIDGLVNYYCFGDGDLMKASLSLTEPADAVSFVSDAEQDKQLWDYPAWRLLCLADYYLFHADKYFLKESWSWVCRTIDWYFRKLDSCNLIYQQVPFGGHQITEWTCAKYRLGYKVSLNSLFYWSLKEMAKLAKVVGDETHYQSWSKLARSVQKAINQKLWVNQWGCYRDWFYDCLFQDSNVLAVISGVANKAQRESILKVLKEKHWSPYGSSLADVSLPRDGNMAGNDVISPLMCAYEAACHFQYGLADDGLELIRRCWGTMLKKGAKTFWEFTWNDSESRWPIPAHGWSSGLAWLLPGCFLGIQPASPGWKEVIFSPRFSSLDRAEAVVPAAGGLILVSYQKTSPGEYLCNFSFPEGVNLLHVKIPEKSRVKIVTGVPAYRTKSWLHFKRPSSHTISFLLATDIL